MTQCLPVQVAYFLAWPVLGAATVLIMQPSDESIKKVSSLLEAAVLSTLISSMSLNKLVTLFVSLYYIFGSAHFFCKNC